MVRSRIPRRDASPFIRWFNFNPVSMQIRWLYYVWGANGHPREAHKWWLRYLRTLPLETPEGLLFMLWQMTAGRAYRWLLRVYFTLKHWSG